MTEELTRVKGELKKWESEFARNYDGRKPGKDDIIAASKDVQVRGYGDADGLDSDSASVLTTVRELLRLPSLY